MRIISFTITLVLIITGCSNSRSPVVTRYETIVESALYGDSLDVAKHLKNGAPVEMRRLGQTALLAAARRADSGILELLLAHGANPSALGYDGKSALDLVADMDSVRAVRVLLEYQAQPTESWMSVMLQPMERGDTVTVALALAAGANPCHDPKASLSPAQAAALRPQSPFMEMFRAHGCDSLDFLPPEPLADTSPEWLRRQLR